MPVITAISIVSYQREKIQIFVNFFLDFTVQPAPIRKTALSALSAAPRLFLLIIRRSLRTSSVCQIHASMICPTDSFWLSCYPMKYSDISKLFMSARPFSSLHSSQLALLLVQLLKE